MSRETKFGVAFIGILLAVFGAMLAKRLMHPSNKGLNHVAAKSPDGSNASLAARPLQAAPPTLVTPKSENSKPPALAGMADPYLNSNSTQWNSTSSSTPPAALAAPIPIADLGDRYGDRVPAKSIDQTPPETMPTETSSSAQPYRSAYAASGDNSTGSSTANSDVPKVAAADPFQNRPLTPTVDTKSTTASSRGDWTKPKTDDIPNNSVSPPVASSVASGSSNSRYATSEPVEPIHRIAAQPLQPYAGQVVAGAVAESGRSNPWDRPAATNGVSAQRPATSTTNWPTDATANSPHYSTASVSSELNGTSAAVGISRDGELYSVQPNDSYWIISEKAYGSGAFFKALHEYNRKKYKDGAEDLHVGQTLSVPDENVLRRTYPDLCPRPRKAVASTQQRLVSATGRLRGQGRVYTVAEGDTLFEIARHELGKPARWGEIYELNRDILGEDFDYLRPGTELILPAGGSDKAPRGETAVRQPDAIFPR